MDDYYKILELSKKCTKEDIKKKYHKLSLKYHPDKNGGSNDKFLKINEAYETLYDIEKRKIYDLKFEIIIPGYRSYRRRLYFNVLLL